MLEFYTGVPGSGKTYRAVDHVYNCFIDSKSKEFGKYKRFFTNINEFHFDVFNNPTPAPFETSKRPDLLRVLFPAKYGSKKTSDSALGCDERVGSQIVRPNSENDLDQEPGHATPNEKKEKKEVAIPLRMDELLESLEELRQLYLDKQPDSVLIDRAAELHLTDTLFVIDEAHNYFDGKNDTLVWWLSYHRHLHQDIILITQNLSLIYRKYLSFGEFFYRAVPSSLRLRGGVFTYDQFIKYQLYKNSHTARIKVKFNPDVYALYGSGANTQGTKVIYKFIAISAFLSIVVFIFFYFISHRLGSGSAEENTVVSASSSPVNRPSPLDLSGSFTVVCVGFECSILGKTLTQSDLNLYTINYKLQPISTSVKGEGIFFRTFARNDRFFKEVLNVQTDSSDNR